MTTVRLYSGTTLLASTTLAPDGSYTFSNVNISSLTGASTLTARQVVGSDESGDSLSLSLTIDRTGPSAPSITGILSDTGSNGSDGVTSIQTLSLSGTAEANTTVTVFRGFTLPGTATANGSSAWSYDYTGTTLAAGSYTFKATATDAAGNVNNDSLNYSVTVDTAAPTASVTAATQKNTVDVTTVRIGTSHFGALCCARDWRYTCCGRPFGGRVS